MYSVVGQYEISLKKIECIILRSLEIVLHFYCGQHQREFQRNQNSLMNMIVEETILFQTLIAQLIDLPLILFYILLIYHQSYGWLFFLSLLFLSPSVVDLLLNTSVSTSMYV